MANLVDLDSSHQRPRCADHGAYGYDALDESLRWTTANVRNQATLVKSLQFDSTPRPSTLHLVQWTDPSVRFDPGSHQNSPNTTIPNSFSM
jgi:hypothetical protein